MTEDPKKDNTSPAKLEPRYPEGYWDNGDEYLRQCFILQHNADYLEFLVRRVWQLDQACKLAEFGCGCGKMGLQLLPLLAPGSTYTGIDQSAQLISSGRLFWADTPYQAELHEGSIYATPFADHSLKHAKQLGKRPSHGLPHPDHARPAAAQAELRRR